MAELGSGNGSDYPTALDTNSTVEVDGTSGTLSRAAVPNDHSSAIIAIQTELGTDPAGTKTDVKTFLQTEHSTDGTHSAVTADSITMVGNLDELSVTIASAATTNIAGAAGNYCIITGTTTITAFGTAQAGTRRVCKFSGALTLTHNATSLILPGGANITTVAGDTAIMVSEGSGNWRCVAYQKAAGTTIGLVQYQRDTDAAVATVGQIPADDTIPQNTEGTQILSVAITPKNTNNRLMIHVKVHLSPGTTTDTMVAALFQDSTADALAAAATTGALGEVHTVCFEYEMAAGTTSATTFKVHGGGNAANGTFNGAGASGTQIFNGVCASSITVYEYTV